MKDLANPGDARPGRKPGTLYARRRVARRNNFAEPILGVSGSCLRKVWPELTGPPLGHHSGIQDRKAENGLAPLVAAEKSEVPRVRFPRGKRAASVGSIHVRSPSLSRGGHSVTGALRGRKNVIILRAAPTRRLAGDNPLGRDIRTGVLRRRCTGVAGLPAITLARGP